MKGVQPGEQQMKKIDVLNIFVILVTWLLIITFWIYSLGGFGLLEGLFSEEPRRIPILGITRDEMITINPRLFFAIYYLGFYGLFIFPTFLIILSLFLKGKLLSNSIKRINSLSVVNLFSILVGSIVYLYSIFRTDGDFQWVYLGFALILNLFVFGVVFLTVYLFKKHEA
jgi:hypothetical protein